MFIFSLSFSYFLKYILIVGPFPLSFGNEYILVAVDYVSKWVEVKKYGYRWIHKHDLESSNGSPRKPKFLAFKENE